MELLVVMALTIGLMMIITNLFFKGRDAMRQSTEKVETAGRARRIMDSLAPLVISAVRTQNHPPIAVFDPQPSNIYTNCRMVVSSREDLLRPGYSPVDPFRPSAAAPVIRMQARYDFEEQTLTLVKLQMSSDDVDTSVDPRLLGRGLTGCEFQRITDYSVAVILETSSERIDERRPEGYTKTVLRGVLTAPGQ